MKKIAALFAASIGLLYAETPSTAIVVSTATVSKVTTREPREFTFRVSRVTGEIELDVVYETVVRVDGSPASWETLKVVTLKWDAITNAVPAMAAALPQAVSAVHASMTNSP